MEKENLCRIADAANTYNTALSIIKAKGYKIFIFPDSREDYLGNFWVIRKNKQFIGADPLRLLGVISIWESTGDDWQMKDFPDEDLFDKTCSRAFPDTLEDLNKLSSIDFQNLISDYQLFFDCLPIKIEISPKTTRKEIFEILNTFYKDEKY